MAFRRHVLLIVLLALIPVGLARASDCALLKKQLATIEQQHDRALKAETESVVEDRCGPETASWVGGPAGAQRYQYLRCRRSARRQVRRSWEQESPEHQLLKDARASVEQQC